MLKHLILDNVDILSVKDINKSLGDHNISASQIISINWINNTLIIWYKMFFGGQM